MINNDQKQGVNQSSELIANDWFTMLDSCLCRKSANAIIIIIMIIIVAIRRKSFGMTHNWPGLSLSPNGLNSSTRRAFRNKTISTIAR